MSAAPIEVVLPGADQPGDAGFTPAAVRRSFSQAVQKKVTSFLAARGLTARVFTLSCWQILLYRLTGLSEMTIGLGTDGRGFEELAGAVGPLARYLPLPFQMSGRTSFNELVSHSAHAIEEALERQDYFSWDLAGRGGAIGDAADFPLSFDCSDKAGL